MGASDQARQAGWATWEPCTCVSVGERGGECRARVGPEGIFSASVFELLAKLPHLPLHVLGKAPSHPGSHLLYLGSGHPSLSHGGCGFWMTPWAAALGSRPCRVLRAM